MDIDFEHFGSRPGRGAGTARAGSPASLDWHGLAARLAAAHAGRQAMSGEKRRGSSATGSFAPGLVRQVAAYAKILSVMGAAISGDAGHDVSNRVNPKTKANGKPPCGIGSRVAGVNKTGVRGLL